MRCNVLFQSKPGLLGFYPGLSHDALQPFILFSGRDAHLPLQISNRSGKSIRRRFVFGDQPFFFIAGHQGSLSIRVAATTSSKEISCVFSHISLGARFYVNSSRRLGGNGSPYCGVYVLNLLVGAA